MIKIGILADSQSGVESIQKIQQLNEFKIAGIIDLRVENTEHQDEIEELMNTSGCLYIDVLGTKGIELMRSALRKSTHVFLKQPLVYRRSEIKQLISFQQEAGSVVQLFNTYLFHPEVIKFKKNGHSPSFIDICINVDKKANQEFELLQILLFLTKIDHSEFRKIEVFALEGESTFLLNLHIQFTSGSVAQLIINAGNMEKQNTRFRIHQKDKAPVVIDMDHLHENSAKSEQNALNHFIKGIAGQSAVLLSMNDLLQATIALHEIKEKLKYPNISLSD